METGRSVAIAVFHSRNNGDSKQLDGGGGRKNGHILKKESKDLTDKLVVKYERKREVWDESMVFALNWVMPFTKTTTH